MNGNEQPKALFLDRDGIINVEKNYVHKIDDFEFIEGIFDLCHAAQKQGYLIIIVTNQAGIGRGYYEEKDFHLLMQWMKGCFRERGINIADMYFCPDHPVHGVDAYKRESKNRKPAPGMIFEACKDWQICLQHSILVGDKESDVIAGKSARVGINILVNTKISLSENADIVFASVKEVARWLENNERKIAT